MANEGCQWQNLLGCDHWVLTGSPEPKMVVFCEFWGGWHWSTFKKKLALKILHTFTYLNGYQIQVDRVVNSLRVPTTNAQCNTS